MKNVMISMVKGITQCVRDQRTNYSVWFSSETSGGEDEDEALDIKSLAIKRPQIHELVSQHSCKLHCHVQMNSIADTTFFPTFALLQVPTRRHAKSLMSLWQQELLVRQHMVQMIGNRLLMDMFLSGNYMTAEHRIRLNIYNMHFNK